MYIKLNTINDVHDFVLICNKYQEAEIEVRQGKQVVDGRSILGIFSLNLLKPLRIIINSENEGYRLSFYCDIEKWKEFIANEIPVS